MGTAPGRAPQDLDLLRNVVGVLGGRDLERVLGLAMDAIVALSGAERAMLVRRRPDRSLSIALARGTPDARLSHSVIGRALDTRRPFVLPNALEDPDFSDRASVQSLRLLSALAVPLVANGEAVAVVYADSTRATGIFPPELAERLGEFVQRITPAIEAGIAEEQLACARTALRKDLDLGGGFADLRGESPSFLRVLEDAARVATTEATVLITGESGTGKELLARAIHQRSPRHAGPFVPVNCAALPEQLLESELFGHRRGSFTGATADRRGKVLSARGGTLFLDEIGEVPPSVQAKLLRALEQKEVQPLGADRPVEVDVRFLAATNRDLATAVREGTFRADLLFRLRVIALEVPPLRERPEDLLPLARQFARELAERHRRPAKALSREAEEALLRYPFPGNVRELLHAIEHAVIFARADRILPGDLPDVLRRTPVTAGGVEVMPRTKAELDRAKESAAEELERAFLHDALTRAEGKVAQAARLTGMNRSVFHQLLRKHGLKAKAFRR